MPAIVANELQDMQLRSAHVTDEVRGHALIIYYILHFVIIIVIIMSHIILSRHIPFFDIIILFCFRRDFIISKIITDFVPTYLYYVLLYVFFVFFCFVCLQSLESTRRMIELCEGVRNIII